MNRQRFFTQLGILSAVMALVIFLVNALTPLRSYSLLSWLSLGLFILLSVGMYIGGYKAAISENKYTFTNAVLGFTIGKMVLSVIVILSYNELAKPESKLFLVPFFAIYVVFTVFETYFMMKLGKMDSQKNKL